MIGGRRQGDTLDLGVRGEARQVLRRRLPAHAIRQVAGDPIPNLLERELAPFDHTFEPDNVVAEA